MQDVEKLELGDHLGVGKDKEKEHHQKSQTSFPQYVFDAYFCF